MLSDHPIDVMLLAPDLAAAREFYETRVGLEVIIENEGFVTFACGGDSRLVVSASSSGPTDTATQASWRVADVRAEVAQLRARGVPISDLPEMGAQDGIVDAGFALAAWFTDPAGNSLGLLQFTNA